MIGPVPQSEVSEGSPKWKEIEDSGSFLWDGENLSWDGVHLLEPGNGGVAGMGLGRETGKSWAW